MDLKRLDDARWEIPQTDGMLVPGIVFASEELIVKAAEDRAIEQVANVAHLPGIVAASYAMPDIHWGYGFPIGGVAATDIDAGGVVSPGGVGFDICCGVRLLATELIQEEFDRHRDRIMRGARRADPSRSGQGRYRRARFGPVGAH